MGLFKRSGRPPAATEPEPPRDERPVPAEPAAASLSRALLEETCQLVERDIDRAIGELTAQNEQAVRRCEAMTEDARSIVAESVSMGDTARRVSGGVGGLVTAAQELSAAGREIAQHAGMSAGRARAAVAEAEAAALTARSLRDASDGINGILRVIAEIAGRTNLLALNATIEAARAGEAGRGFAVVAAEVKSLAAQTRALTDDIGRRVAQITVAADGTAAAIDTVGRSVSQINEASASVAAAIEQQHATVQAITSCVEVAADDTNRLAGDVGSVSERARVLARAAGETRSAMAETSAVMEDLQGRLVLSLRNSAFGNRRAAARVPVEIEARVIVDGRAVTGLIADLSAGGALFRAAEGQDGLRARGAMVLEAEGLGRLDVECVGGGAGRLHLMYAPLSAASAARIGETLADVARDDKRFIEASRDGAASIAKVLEQALASGEISPDALFSPRYESVADSEPHQHLTLFTPLTDRAFPSIQEPFLALDRRVIFAAAVDRNGYLPTHNLKYNQPQRAGDVAWNAANCRNRRIFADRAGLAAARCSGEPALQIYERDMGDGKRVLLKEADAPIVVRGRPWGGFRLCYRMRAAAS